MKGTKIAAAATAQHRRTILHLALPWYRNELVERLLQRDGIKASTPDQFGLTGLHSAAQDASIDVLTTILRKYREESTNMNLADCHGRTALYVASYANQADAVKGLLAQGLNPDLRDKNGLTAEELAAKSNSDAVLGVFRSINLAPSSPINALGNGAIVLHGDSKISPRYDPKHHNK